MAAARQVNTAELKSRDFVPRGNKSSSPFNTTLYLSMRALDCFWQYHVLAFRYGSSVIGLFGLSVIATPTPLHTGILRIDMLGLSAYRLVILSMNIIAALKHFWFVLRVAQEAWTLTGAIVVGLDNIFFDTLNNLLFLTAFASAASATPVGETLNNPYLVVGATLFVLGIAGECICEVDRKLFKSYLGNKGKPYTGGFFAVVRHPNYTAFTVWRAGLALATSGVTYAILTSSFFMWDFSVRAVPALDEYCSKRYGDAWTQYKRTTAFTLIPFLL